MEDEIRVKIVIGAVHGRKEIAILDYAGEKTFESAQEIMNYLAEVDAYSTEKETYEKCAETAVKELSTKGVYVFVAYYETYMFLKI